MQPWLQVGERIFRCGEHDASQMRWLLKVVNRFEVGIPSHAKGDSQGSFCEHQVLLDHCFSASVTCFRRVKFPHLDKYGLPKQNRTWRFQQASKGK